MSTKICKICGKSFESKSSRRSICYEDHYHPCPVCGKLTVGNDMQHLNSCCSIECSRKKASNTTHQTYEEWPSNSDSAKQKRVETNVQKYGVDNPSKLPDVKSQISSSLKATWGTQKDNILSKTEQTCLSKYGQTHYMKSDEGKQHVSDVFTEKYGVKTSLLSDIVRDKIEKTNLEKYGSVNPFASADVQEKIKQTNMLRYGYQYSASSSEVREKMKSTMVNRYGVAYPLQSKVILKRARETFSSHMKSEEFRQQRQENTEATNIARYGTRSAMSNIEVQTRIQSTNLSRYGVASYTSSDDFKQKRLKTFKIKYGSDNPMKSEAVKQRLSDTMKSRYGVQHASQLNMSDISKIDELIRFRSDPAQYISSLPESERTESIIADKLGVTPSAVSNYVVQDNLHHLVSYSKSTMEDEIANFLSQNNVSFIRNCRSVISPYELDFYLPDRQLAIECNPTVTHNSSFHDPWNGNAKSPSYHKMKTDMCEKNGIFLFHIFGYEWTHRKNIILSMLSSLLHMSNRKIYARNTYVSEIDSAECAEFLESNHRQGGRLSASIRLGLRCKDTNELVSVMTFNKIRNTIGYTGQVGVELSRFCSSLNTSVVGGASKLFTHYLNNIHSDELGKIISFSDRSHTRGNLYSKLGFLPVSGSNPGYVWVNMVDDSYYNRVSCQKRNLQRLFNDTSIDVDNQTERQIMESHGYAQVFDSGTIRWEYLS